MNRYPLVRLLVLVGLCAFWLPATNSQAAGQKSLANSQAQAELADVPTDQIIIRYKAATQAFADPSGASQMDRLNQIAGVALRYFRPMSGDAHVLKLPGRMPLAAVRAITDKLAALSEVQYAEPDQVRLPIIAPPNDPYFVASPPSNQWDLYDPVGGINMQAAWDITTGSPSVVAAIGDTGLTNHVDLAGRMVSGSVATSGYDFVSNTTIANDGDGRDSNPSDPGDWVTSAESTNPASVLYGCQVSDSSWHGSHVAGTIGAASNNSVGVAGINWTSPLLIMRVLGKCGGYDSDIIDGVKWGAGLAVSGVPANANPAKVINLSLGGSGSCSSTWQTAINNLTSAGAVLVVAAGNSNVNVSGFSPANCNGVVTVAATGQTGSKASYSNYGAQVEISAPGGSGSYYIWSTINAGTQGPTSDTYGGYQGTSMAAPHVTGVVSLMFSINPTLAPSQVLSILQGTARAFPGGSSCNTSNCGSGILDAGAAVAAAQSPGAFNKTSPANGAIAQPLNASLQWATSARATSYSYCVDTSDNNTCNASWVSAGANTSITASGLSAATTYYWQVRSNNGWVDTYADANTWGSFTTQTPMTLNVSPAGTGSGTVTSDPAGIDCGSTCQASFDLDSSVTLTAVADTGSIFTGWGGDCSGVSTCVLTMSAARSVTATYTLETYALDVSVSGAGSGVITSNPAGIDCGLTCSHSYDFNTSVTLTATPAVGSAFTGWSGAGCSGTGTCVVTMDLAKSVTASFELAPFKIFLPMIIQN